MKPILASLAIILTTATLARAEDWPCWRGPTRDGVSRDTHLPTEWTKRKNIAWRVEVPGIGHSSPIVWGERVYVTSATGPADKVHWWLFCFDRTNGEHLWKTEAATGRGEKFHNKHGRASSTPATDGEFIWTYFGAGGAACIDSAGKVVWHARIRDYSNPWGSAGSVLLDGERVYLNADDDEDPFLIALDKKTGATIWKTERPGQSRSFSTPAIVSVPGTDRREIVVNGYLRVKGYDAETGAELWTVEGMKQYVTPTPIVADGLVYCSSGRAGPTMAIRPGGSGDVTKTHVVWTVPTGSPYISSPVLWDNFLFMINGTGVGYGVDATKGKVLWQERLGAAKEGFSNSPIAADGLIYAFDEEGGCTILRAADKFEKVAYNTLSERCLTSPAASDGQLFVRTDRHLFCIGQRRPARSEEAAGE